MYNDVVPEENLEIYKLLYKIEVGLREFIIELLEAQCGSRWWKQRLPPDVLKVYRKGREYVRNIRWCQLVPHHPIYYIEFPDLKKVIQRSDNWREVFKSVFVREEVLIGTLTELEPIRNKIAHNRKATTADWRIVEGAYHKIAAAIGDERFSELVARCTLAKDLPQRLLQLREEATLACTCCRECRPLGALEAWHGTRESWWFDPEYLGHQLDAINEYFETLDAYRQLPRSRGSGYRIEAWVRSEDVERKGFRATKQLSALLDDLGGE